MPAGVRLDLGATAKAWAADRAAARIAAAPAAACWSAWAATSPSPARPGRRLADPGAGRHRRPRDPPAGRSRSRPPRRRPGHLQHRGAPLAARRRRGAPHPRPAHRPARRTRLADGVGGRGQLRRRQRGQHRGDRPRPPGARLAGSSSACPPDWSTRPAPSPPWPAGRLNHQRRGDEYRFWYPSRATGIVSLLLLTPVGARHPGQPAGPATRPAEVRRDRYPPQPLAALGGVHRGARRHGGARQLRAHPLLSAVIPFASGYERLWIGLGAISVDLMAAMIVTSLLRGRMNRVLWRAVHLPAYASWPLAFGHSLGASNDLQQGWLLLLAFGCALVAAAALAWRLAHAARQVPRAARVAEVYARHTAQRALHRTARRARRRPDDHGAEHASRPRDGAGRGRPAGRCRAAPPLPRVPRTCRPTWPGTAPPVPGPARALIADGLRPDRPRRRRLPRRPQAGRGGPGPPARR